MSLVVLALLAQALPERPMPRPTVEHPEPFTVVGAIHELPDGRLLVVDSKDAAVRLVDFAGGTTVPVGRQGGGPGEYRAPGRFVIFGRDSVLLTDPRQRRSLLVSPMGALGATFRIGTNEGSLPDAARTPAAGDAAGRLYFAGSALDPNEPLKIADSVPILRLDRAAGRLDTLARILVARRDIQTTSAGGVLKAVEIRLVPFVPHDDWAVLPDGRVLVLRTGDYHLEVVGPDGKRTSGPRLPYVPIKTTALDRAGLPGDLAIPAQKPPFSGPSTRPSPNGYVWIQRTMAATDSVFRYDVLDLSGRLVARVACPPRTRLAGFGRGAMYLVRRDEDDLEYVGRAPLPALFP
ncbi:MAG: hypothetical protein HOP28_03545 [Gemmatimonadales bacterium]|nr:hypothetical protein [Gemmatimonadales bacterium]